MSDTPKMVDISEASIRKHHLEVIEELRAERDEALNQLSSMTHCTHILEKRVEILVAENKQLREALAPIIAATHDEKWLGKLKATHLRRMVYRWGNICRAAFEDKK